MKNDVQDLVQDLASGITAPPVSRVQSLVGKRQKRRRAIRVSAFVLALVAVGATATALATSEDRRQVSTANDSDRNAPAPVEPAPDVDSSTTSTIATSANDPDELSTTSTVPVLGGGFVPDIDFDVISLESVLVANGMNEWTPGLLERVTAAERAEHEQREDFITVCMEDRGLLYLSEPFLEPWRPQFSAEEGTVDWVRQNGLGFSTAMAGEDLLDGTAVGFIGPRPTPPSDPGFLAQAQYEATLSPEEHSRYSIELRGVDPQTFEFDDEGVIVGNPLDPDERAQSCDSLARAEVPGAFKGADERRLGAAIRLSADWRAYQAEGNRCLRSTDLEIDSMDEVYSSIQSVFESFLEEESSVDPLAPGTTSLPSNFIEGLSAAQDLEFQVADALYECGFHPIQQRAFFSQLTEQLLVARPEPSTADSVVSGDAYVGLPEREAAEIARNLGQDWRTIEVDGIEQAVRLDFLAERLNFVIRDGLVIEAATDQELRDTREDE